MRHVGCSAALTFLAIGAVILLAFTPMTSVVIALAATALYMGGTGHPLSIPQDTTEYIASYVAGADSNYVTPSGLCPDCTPVAVYTPEQLRFDTGLWDMTFDKSVAVGRANLDDCLRGSSCTVTDPPYTTTGTQQLTENAYVVFGYSQSATIASIEKSLLIAHPPTGTVSFVLMANPNRPNGGILERFVGAYIPIIGVTFNGAAPTNSPEPTPLTTVDLARQYDPVSDFPTNPLNLLADLNVLLGFFYVHPETAYFDINTTELQGQYQDTTYYLAPTTTLPLLMPLAQMPLIGRPLAAMLDPPLRVLVEAGYNRTINPGQPTPAQYLYFPNPIKTAIDFLVAIPTGWDNAIAEITGNPANRPFHTTPQPTYGVGGPPVYAGAVDPYGPPTPVTAASTPVPLTSTTSETSVSPTFDQAASEPAADRRIASAASKPGESAANTPTAVPTGRPVRAANARHGGFDTGAADLDNERDLGLTDLPTKRLRNPPPIGASRRPHSAPSKPGDSAPNTPTAVRLGGDRPLSSPLRGLSGLSKTPGKPADSSPSATPTGGSTSAQAAA